jgi:hypothetical protein
MTAAAVFVRKRNERQRSVADERLEARTLDVIRRQPAACM